MLSGSINTVIFFNLQCILNTKEYKKLESKLSLAAISSRQPYIITYNY